MNKLSLSFKNRIKNNIWHKQKKLNSKIKDKLKAINSPKLESLTILDYVLHIGSFWVIHSV